MFDTFGMPSASEARYGAPPEASRSPLRCISSVSVTKSMACCTSPSAIICVNTRRCWSRKKSSGRKCSIAGFSAWLSSRIAPRTERSASRLFGKGFSSDVSTGIQVFLVFAFSSLLYHGLRRRASADFFAGASNFTRPELFRGLCVELPRASIGLPVHHEEIYANLFVQKKVGPQHAAAHSRESLTGGIPDKLLK